MRSKAIMGIAIVVVVLASAVGVVSGVSFNAEDCPTCLDSELRPYNSYFGYIDYDYTKKALCCGYNDGTTTQVGMYGRTFGEIKIWPYDQDAEKAASRFEQMRNYDLTDLEVQKDEKINILSNNDSEFVYIEYIGVCIICYDYSVSGCFLYRENYVIGVDMRAKSKNEEARCCKPHVGGSMLCIFDGYDLTAQNDVKTRFNALVECAKSLIDKKCGEKDDEAIIKPDNTSCKDFDVDAKDFDLAYDNKMLRKEFLEFLKDYGSTHELKSASDKYAGSNPSNQRTEYLTDLGYFLFTTNLEKVKDSKFMTGKENELGKRIDERFKKEGRPLKPAEVFEESLKINDNCVFDALLTSHNYLKQAAYDFREPKTKEWKGNYDSKKKSIEKLEIKLEGKGVLDPVGQIIESPYLDEDAQKTIKLLDNFKKEVEELENFRGNAEMKFKRLKQLRKEEDNEGAWYHLFVTLTMGYVMPEVTNNWWGSSAYVRALICGEHWFYKGIIKWKDYDKVEYCWDVWGGYLGGEIYSTLLDNQEKVKERIKEHPEVWVIGAWDPSYIIDAYTGQKIDE
jgi:hypothetical protein